LTRLRRWTRRSTCCWTGKRSREVGPAGKDCLAAGAEILDASGLIVAPGFIDLHAHLREPGQESSETIETGTRAAARGGFTAVCSMPNTKPVNDNASGDAIHPGPRESGRERARLARMARRRLEARAKRLRKSRR